MWLRMIYMCALFLFLSQWLACFRPSELSSTVSMILLYFIICQCHHMNRHHGTPRDWSHFLATWCKMIFQPCTYGKLPLRLGTSSEYWKLGCHCSGCMVLFGRIGVFGIVSHWTVLSVVMFSFTAWTALLFEGVRNVNNAFKIQIFLTD